MNYTNAIDILPKELVLEIQKYVQGETLYIPQLDNKRKGWGTASGGRIAIDQRNEEIRSLFQLGNSIQQLSAQYFLSTETIKKVVYRKK